MDHFLRLILALSVLISLGNAADWGYYDGPVNESPDYWHVNFPTCGGVRQSPIDIRTDRAEHSSYLERDPLRFSNYDVVHNDLHIENNGHTIEIEVEDFDHKGITISGGGLPGRYHLAQFHFHWGATNYEGSEHTVNGQAYAAVIHFVHVKEEYLSDTSIVTRVGDGYAVIGVFVKVGRHNPAFDDIVAKLDAASAPESEDNHVSIYLPALRAFLPRDTGRFYRYFGSLTTPACTETVIWTVMEEYIEISQYQLDAFRNMVKKDKEGPRASGNLIVNNYRPTKPLNGRRVQKSFGDRPGPYPGPPSTGGDQGMPMSKEMLIVIVFFGGLAAGLILMALMCFMCGAHFFDNKRKEKKHRTVTVAPTHGVHGGVSLIRI